MLQQARMERPNRKPIPLSHASDRARKNQSSSPSTTAELIPATPRAERAIANVLRRTATRVPNPVPDQAATATQVRRDGNRAPRRRTSASFKKWSEFVPATRSIIMHRDSAAQEHLKSLRPI